MLATARMFVFEVPQALFKLLGKISLYSFVLTFHLAFVIYHNTKPSSDDARGSPKPEEPGVSDRDYRFSPIKLSSGVLDELVSPHNEGDTPFVANIPWSRLRSSTISSEIARHSSSNTSVATLVEQTDQSKETADVYPTTPVSTRKHGTIFPDSEWATMNSTQIRRIRRAVKRVKYKEEHGPPHRDVRNKTSKKDKENVMENDREHEQEHEPPPRDVRSKASKITKTSTKDKEHVVENDREQEQEISKEDKQEDDFKESQTKDHKESDQKSVKKYDEDVKEDDTENDDDEGFVEGLTDDVLVYDKEGVEEDFITKDEEGVKEGATVGTKELREDDNRGVEEQFAGENEDVKENGTEDDNVRLEEDLMEDDESGEEDLPKVDNEGVEDNVTVYDSAIVEEIFTVNDNEGVDEGVRKCDYERVQDDFPKEHNEVVVNGDDNEGHTKTAADGACKFTPPTHHRNLRQRNGVIMIPSLIKGWPPVLLSEPIMDRLDPIDFKIMQLECEYHLSCDRFV
ncbi:hypothetical protein F4604DRAFT_1922385 [Suillus subluteus]|nr:hypothetical protein F4604DRAFT_1922385 [Suillus subluteus]